MPTTFRRVFCQHSRLKSYFSHIEPKRIAKISMEESIATNKKNSLWPIAVAGGMLVGLLVLIVIATRFRDSGIGKPLPSLDLKPLLLVEQPITTEQLKNKVVVLHTWGSWCPDCRREFPSFIKIYEHFKDRDDVIILCVSCSPEEESDLDKLKQETEQYLTSLSASIPIYCDPVAYTRGQLAMIVPSGSSHYPTTIITNRRGEIVRIWEERLPEAQEVIGLIENAAKQ